MSKGVDARAGILQAPPTPCAVERLKSFIRSIRLSLSRRSADIHSTGFTRAISICVEVAVGALVAPIVANSWACAANDQAAATPPNRLMNLWHLIAPPCVDLVRCVSRRRSENQTEECHIRSGPHSVSREQGRTTSAASCYGQNLESGIVGWSRPSLAFRRRRRETSEVVDVPLTCPIKQ